MVSLVGYTGFVGSNIYAGGGIDCAYNSKNIRLAYGTAPDLLIYAGLRAEKYLANMNPEADMALVYQAEENIRKIAPRKLVLISTIDVFRNPAGPDEDAAVDTNGLHAYGINRYRLERWVRDNYADALIIRLPGLYGKNLKKNFIYDYINVIPYMLKQEKFEELSAVDARINDYYELQQNGFYRCGVTSWADRQLLKGLFSRLGFTALNFTDSRNVYQFYPLSRLWNDMQTALNNHLTMLHTATEPVSAEEVYEYLANKSFNNEIAEKPIYYDYRTKYDKLFDGGNGYLMNREQVLEDIARFVGDYR